MTNDQILQVARECGANVQTNAVWMNHQDLITFAHRRAESAEKRIRQLEKAVDYWERNHTTPCGLCGCTILVKPSTPAAEPEKPVCFGLDDCSSHALSVCSVRDECGKKANETR